jgi:hypothetical protein
MSEDADGDGVAGTDATAGDVSSAPKLAVATATAIAMEIFFT